MAARKARALGENPSLAKTDRVFKRARVSKSVSKSLRGRANEVIGSVVARLEEEGVVNDTNRHYIVGRLEKIALQIGELSGNLIRQAAAEFTVANGAPSSTSDVRREVGDGG